MLQLDLALSHYPLNGENLGDCAGRVGVLAKLVLFSFYLDSEMIYS